MGDIKEITEALVKFRNERYWEQFHNPKNLAVALKFFCCLNEKTERDLMLALYMKPYLIFLKKSSL